MGEAGCHSFGMEVGGWKLEAEGVECRLTFVPSLLGGGDMRSKAEWADNPISWNMAPLRLSVPFWNNTQILEDKTSRLQIL